MSIPTSSHHLFIASVLAAAASCAAPLAGADFELAASAIPSSGLSTASDVRKAVPSDSNSAMAYSAYDLPSGNRDAINDARLYAGFLPDHATANGNGFSWDHNYSIGVLYMRSLADMGDVGSFIIGGEGAFNNGSRNDQGDRTSYYGGMADILLGWGYRLPMLTNLHFEGTPFFGIGADHFDDDIGGSPTAFAYEYGLRVAGYWTFENLLQAGLDVRLTKMKSHPEFGGSVGGVDVATSGVAFLFTVGKRF